MLVTSADAFLDYQHGSTDTEHQALVRYAWPVATRFLVDAVPHIWRQRDGKERTSRLKLCVREKMRAHLGNNIVIVLIKLVKAGNTDIPIYRAQYHRTAALAET